MNAANPNGPQSLVEGLAVMNTIAEAVVGYRQKLVDGGVPPTTADAMALEYHATIMGVVTTQFLGKVGVRK